MKVKEVVETIRMEAVAPAFHRDLVGKNIATVFFLWMDLLLGISMATEAAA